MKRNAVPVRDMHTGQTWSTVSACAAELGVSHNGLKDAIRNHRACAGRWIVLDQPDAYCACCEAKIEAKARGKLSIFKREEVAA